jgi:hypothetical protein
VHPRKQVPDSSAEEVRRQFELSVDDSGSTSEPNRLDHYAGHGPIEPRTGALHLAVGDSDWMSLHGTAAPYEWIRRSIEQSPAARKIVAIDCCCSARAFGVQSADAGTDLDVIRPAPMPPSGMLTDEFTQAATIGATATHLVDVLPRFRPRTGLQVSRAINESGSRRCG